MKIKLNKKIIIAVFFAIIWMVLNNVSFAGTQKWKSLDYDAKLNSDGSMDVVETWNIYISETNTVFKNFDLDSKKFSGITNVKVKDLSSGMSLTRINQEMYHVTKNCYYALPISGNKFEIAWGVGLDDSSATKKYEISYTVENVISIYNDCSELYWQFLGIDNSIKADKITGTIKLPQKVKSLDNLRVWAHGPLNGEIHKTSKDTVSFEVSDFSSKTMLEVRVAVEEDMFYNFVKMVNSNKLEDIIAEETVWANQANNQRRQAKLMYWTINIVIGIIFVFFLFKIKKYLKELKEVKAERYQIDIGQYFRDIPREKEATPVEAGYLYYSKKNNFNIGSNISKVFSATLLQLCLKGYISFDCEDTKDIKINLLNCIKDTDGKAREQLKPSENSILELLHKMAKEPYISISMSEIKKYAKKNYDEFDSVMSELTMRGKLANNEVGNYDNDKAKKATSYRAKGAFYISGLIFGVVFFAGLLFVYLPIYALAIAVEFIICAIILMKTANEVNILTEQGEMERQQWKGLKKYMEDFSMLKEREIPDLVLWEKYLVYATAFGISDKVIKQLKLVYPQMQNLDSGTYTYLYLMSDTRFSNGFVNEFNDGIKNAYTSYRNAYNSAHSSSGSGSGGGFSGGGGGRRWRWPDAVADSFL